MKCPSGFDCLWSFFVVMFINRLLSLEINFEFKDLTVKLFGTIIFSKVNRNR